MFVSQGQDHCLFPKKNSSKGNAVISISGDEEAEDGWGNRGGRDELSR